MKPKLLLFILLIPFLASAETVWQRVSPGMEYTRIQNIPDYPAGSIHAFRIDPSLYEFRLSSPYKTSVPLIMNQNNAVLAVNGGFFTPDHQPLGLRISQGKLLSKMRPTSWWGVFYISNSQPKIASQKEFQNNSAIDFAIQAGPRLVVNGNIPKLVSGNDARTALGITADKKIIVLATDQVYFSTAQLAEIMRASEKENGLACKNAINLDGGNSTQLYTHLPTINIQRSSLVQVADFVLVIPKQRNNEG